MYTVSLSFGDRRDRRKWRRLQQQVRGWKRPRWSISHWLSWALSFVHFPRYYVLRFVVHFMTGKTLHISFSKFDEKYISENEWNCELLGFSIPFSEIFGFLIHSVLEHSDLNQYLLSEPQSLRLRQSTSSHLRVCKDVPPRFLSTDLSIFHLHFVHRKSRLFHSETRHWRIFWRTLWAEIRKPHWSWRVLLIFSIAMRRLVRYDLPLGVGWSQTRCLRIPCCRHSKWPN